MAQHWPNLSLTNLSFMLLNTNIVHSYGLLLKAVSYKKIIQEHIQEFIHTTVVSYYALEGSGGGGANFEI